MFSIPRKLSSSLGIIGDDPKLAFRTQASGLRRLLDNRVSEGPLKSRPGIHLALQSVPASDIDYWGQVSCGDIKH